MGVKSKVLIIDDDVRTVEKLTEMLSDYPDLQVAGNASTLAEGERMVAEVCPDLLFLDIELPDGNGLEFIDTAINIKSDIYVVVFTGFYKDYSERAFSGKESDYLLKPINVYELDKSVQRYRRAITGKRTHVLKGNSEPGLGDVFTAATVTNEMRIMRPAEIGYFRYSTRRKVWEVALSDHSFVQLKKGTSAADILAYNPQFVQTHQSYIVNMRYLTLIGSTQCTLYPPFNEDDVLVGRRFSRELKSRFTLI